MAVRSILYLQLILLGFLVLPKGMMAQKNNDSLRQKQDYTQLQELEHSPKKAAYMSLALPGLGQAYNKKYWKIPIVYAALGTVGYLWYDNNQQYQDYRQAYINYQDNDSLNDNMFPGYDLEDLREFKNYHWRYRDLNAFIFVGIWALNILDAVVDAHLYTFDVGEDLSMRIQPAMTAPMAFGRKPSYGLSLTLTF
jgi:hypothetical protein